MRATIASLAALILSASPAFSQKKKAPPAVETISFRTLALADTKLPQLWVTASGKAVPISFSSSQPSAILKADKTNPFKIYKAPPDDKGQPTDTSPALLDLPAAPTVLLLGWMENENPVFLAVADSIATAKNDDWLIINRSKKPLTIQIGATATPVPVEPNMEQVVKCTAPAGEGAATTISIKQDDGTMKAVYSSYLPVFADKRGILAIVQNGERIKVSYIEDQIPAKAAAKKKR